METFMNGRIESGMYAVLMQRFQRVLENEEISMKLRQLKDLDTIELAGTAPNGRERVLINEVIRQFGVDAVKESEAAKLVLPLIPEGVLKSRTKNVVYYTYFRAEDPGKESDTFNLTIADHQLCSGVFQLLFVGHMSGIPKIYIHGMDSGFTSEFTCRTYQTFLASVSDEALRKEMTAGEIEMLRKDAHDHPEKHRQTCGEAQKTFHYVLNTFRAINFLNEQKRNAQKAELSSSPPAPLPSKEPTEAEANTDSADTEKKTADTPGNNQDSVRTLKMGDWYTYRGRKVKSKAGKTFIRRTEQWLVTGHMRHYKSGKTVYIQPYYKGPGRDKGRMGKTVIKIKERKGKE